MQAGQVGGGARGSRLSFRLRVPQNSVGRRESERELYFTRFRGGEKRSHQQSVVSCQQKRQDAFGWEL